MPQRKCPSKILLILERARYENLYLMSQLGPTSWLVGEIGDSSNSGSPTSEYRVSLGERHSCTCAAHRVTQDICHHLGWILTRKLKLTPSDPLCCQLGMTDRELNSLLSPAKTTRQRCSIIRRTSDNGDMRRPVRPKKYRQDDPCPICLEEFSKKSSPVVYCKYSCGQPMHGHCMQIVAKHQKNEVTLVCPLCRGEFSTRAELRRMLSSGGRCDIRARSSSLPPLAKHGLACILCNTPVAGSLFKCLNCPNVLTCSICVSSEKYSMHFEHGLVVKNTPFDKWKITTVKRDQHSRQMKCALPRLVRSGKNTNKTAEDKASTIQCPVCTDQGYSVITLECGHLVPTPEVERPTSPAHPQLTTHKPMTRTPRGRLARTPLNLSASSTSIFRPPPPEVIVQRVELASRINTGPIAPQQRSRSQPRRCTSAFVKPNKKKLIMTESSDGDKRFNPSPPDPRENGRILGSKVLPIMALLLQKRADESNEEKDSAEGIEDTRPENAVYSPQQSSQAKTTGSKQKLAIQCVQLLPDAEPPLSNKPCSSRRQCRA